MLCLISIRCCLIFLVIYVLMDDQNQVSGLMCNTCPSLNPNCRDATRRCSEDQMVCSYVIDGSGGIRKNCEQRHSCETTSREFTNCKRGQCKFCCLEDDCNRMGPGSCSCINDGQCKNSLRSNDPILFCYKVGRENRCVTRSSWNVFNSSRGFYIANHTSTDVVASCQITRRQRKIDEFAEQFNLTLRCSSIRTISGTRTSIQQIHQFRLGTKPFTAAQNFFPERGMRVICDRTNLSDYQYDWYCRPEIVKCAFFRDPPLTTVQPTTVAPTELETVAEPIVAAGLDLWAYILIVIVTLGVIMFAGFSRNIIKACKEKGYYKVSRIGPWQRRMMASKANRQSKLTTVHK